MQRRLQVSAVILAGLAFGSARAAPEQVVTGPNAQYWMSVSTTSGMAAMMGQGGRPSMGAIMGMAMGGSGPSASGQRSLLLQLGSVTAPPAAPSGQHLPPTGLGAGAPLPLVSPDVKKAPPPEQDRVERFRKEKPDGKILIYWGCGEHAPANQPVVIDLGKLASDPASAARLAGSMRGMPVTPENPPSPGRFASYGEWPNARSSRQPEGSLVGAHKITANYAPEINFSLASDQDFMGPINLDAGAKLASGAVDLRWGDVSEAKAFFAWAIGSSNDKTMVLWSSANAGSGGFAAPAYLSNSDIRRLVAEGWLMKGETRACTVPAEVVQSTQRGAVTFMTAYGGEADFAYPPRPRDPKVPWRIDWTTKVRYHSTTMAMLGQAGGGPDMERRAPPEPKKRPGFPGLPGIPGVPGLPIPGVPGSSN